MVTEKKAPPADGSDSAGRALQRLYPRESGESLIMAGDPYMEQVFQQLLEARAQVDREERRASELKQAIRQRMGEATRAAFSTGSVTWKRSKDPARLDADRLAREHPDIYHQYLEPKPGSRRFLIHEQP